jgi:hypothetical protein
MLASIHLRRSLGACAVLLLLSACEHGEGGVCQGSRDCEDGLVCDLTLDETRGVCRSPEDIDAGSDAGALPDEPDPRPDLTDASIDGGGADAGAAGSGAPPLTDAGGDSGLVNHEDAGSDGDGG